MCHSSLSSLQHCDEDDFKKPDFCGTKQRQKNTSLANHFMQHSGRKKLVMASLGQHSWKMNT